VREDVQAELACLGSAGLLLKRDVNWCMTDLYCGDWHLQPMPVAQWIGFGGKFSWKLQDMIDSAIL
jgi:hypothetical protein